MEKNKTCLSCGKVLQEEENVCSSCGGIHWKYLPQERNITDVALVRKSGQYFYIDQTGTPISWERYANAQSFSGNLAAVQVDGKWGYIDKTGTMVIPPRFAWAKGFSWGMAAVSENGTDWGFINTTGKLAIPCRKEWEYAGDFHDCYARVKCDGKYGFLNINQWGEGYVDLAIPADWVKAGEFSDCLAWVEGESQYPLQKCCGCVDTHGQLAIPLKFMEMGSGFGGSNALVQGVKIHRIDRKGNKEITFRKKGWDLLYPPRRFGRRIHVAKFVKSIWWSSSEEGYDEEDLETRHGFIDDDGKLCIPCTWENVKDFAEGLAAVRKNELWGYINQEGKTVIPCRWSDCGSFSRNLAAVAAYNRWGFINRGGLEVIPLQYDWAAPFVFVNGPQW